MGDDAGDEIRIARQGLVGCLALHDGLYDEPPLATSSKTELEVNRAVLLDVVVGDAEVVIISFLSPMQSEVPPLRRSWFLRLVQLVLDHLLQLKEGGARHDHERDGREVVEGLHPYLEGLQMHRMKTWSFHFVYVRDLLVHGLLELVVEKKPNSICWHYLTMKSTKELDIILFAGCTSSSWNFNVMSMQSGVTMNKNLVTLSQGKTSPGRRFDERNLS